MDNRIGDDENNEQKNMDIVGGQLFTQWIKINPNVQTIEWTHGECCFF